MKKHITSREIDIIVANANKPTSYSNYEYPINSLNDRVFEILLYSIFTKRNENENSKFHNFCDEVILMPGVGEKGMDSILKKESKISGVIQCKKYSRNLSPDLILTELTKFAIHYHVDSDSFVKAEEINYFIATSTGYSLNSIQLKDKLKDKTFISEYDFDTILAKTLKKYKEFNSLEIKNVKPSVINYISKFKYEFITPQKINVWINDYPVLIDSFFEIRKVTDNKLIKKESKKILKKIENITTKKDEENITVFTKKYYIVAKDKLDAINFIGFDLHKHRQKPTDITLSELYIQPNFKQRVFDKNDRVISVVDNDLNISNIFKSEKNIIVLGDPGAGKSLLVKFVMLQIFTGKAAKIGLLKYENYIPFRVTLRKYYEVREKNSIIEYLSNVLSNQYQAQISISLLTKIITERKCLIFFDGLDEIFNVTHKNELKELIESFSIAHPNAKCVVTSRFIGYHDVKFKPEQFDEFAIKHLNENQISELVDKFFSTQIKNLNRKRTAIQNCMSQLEKDVDEELKSNPLILSLILILTSNNIIIPDSKLEIYESCTKTLVESIDSNEKELKFTIPVKNRRITFASLAYWQYEALSNGDKVSYEKTKRKLAEFFLARKEAQEYVEAEDIAIKFLEYAERRSIYFEDNFTHKTFLEYYTADYLYINFFTKASDNARKELLSIISIYLKNPFWYIVFELLFSRIDGDQADNEVMDDFLLKQVATNSIDVFYFLISNISSYTNISDEIKELIIKKTIWACIKGEKLAKQNKKVRFEENSIVSKIHLLSKKDDYFNLVQKVITEMESEVSVEKKQIEFYNFYFELTSFEYMPEKKIEVQNTQLIEELSLKDSYLFSNYNLRNGIKNLSSDLLIKQIEYFGIKSLFKDIDFKFRENIKRVNLFDIFLISVIENQDVNKFSETYQVLFNYGIKEDTIINHMKETRVYYFHRDTGFKNLLDIYVKSQDNILDKIIISLIETMPDKQSDYEKYRNDNKSRKLKTIDEIFKASR